MVGVVVGVRAASIGRAVWCRRECALLCRIRRVVLARSARVSVSTKKYCFYPLSRLGPGQSFDWKPPKFLS